MKVRNHPKIVDWPPQPGGTNVRAESPQAELQVIITKVHVGSVVDQSVPLSGEYKRNPFTYDVLTKDRVFTKRLATEFSKHAGETLEKFGDLDVDF